MNIFVYELASGKVAPSPDISPRKFVVEDNVGESIHVHLRNLRLEMSVRDFDLFANNLVTAKERIEDGDR